MRNFAVYTVSWAILWPEHCRWYLHFLVFLYMHAYGVSNLHASIRMSTKQYHNAPWELCMVESRKNGHTVIEKEWIQLEFSTTGLRNPQEHGSAILRKKSLTAKKNKKKIMVKKSWEKVMSLTFGPWIWQKPRCFQGLCPLYPCQELDF